MRGKVRRLPPMGLRIIKSAAAVFLCYCVDALRNGGGIVFYSQLAALWCMQDYVKETWKNAYQRTVGTVVGALYGLAVLLLFSALYRLRFPERVVVITTVPLAVALILYTTVLLNRKQAAYFSCVVFLSIVVNHMEDANPYLFVWNRFLDTMIGIGLGVAVNSFHLPRMHNRDILFLSGLDDTLLAPGNRLSAYSRVELNRMIDDGALFTVSTMRTPASLMEPLRDIRLKLPVIVMDGAALFDIAEKRYVRTYVISCERSKEITTFLREQGVNWFANVIIDDMLVIYYQDTEEEIYNRLIDRYRRSPYRNYVKRELPGDEEVVYFMLIHKRERVQEIYEEMVRRNMTEYLKILEYDSEDYPGYAYIKIYNHNAVKENMIHYLKQELKVDCTVTFGSVEGCYTHTVQPGNSDQVVRIMKREFEPVRWTGKCKRPTKSAY